MNDVLDWLLSFRLRLLFRGVFLLLSLAVLAMAVAVLQDEKQRSYDNYAAGFAKTTAQILARLRHPAGQLALLNPTAPGADASLMRPVMLPFAAIDFDDQNKARNAVEMAGCLVQYPNQASLCIAIGNSAWAGGFVYAAGSFASDTLLAHRIGEEAFAGAHRLRITARLRNKTTQWIAPFEMPMGSITTSGDGVRGRFTGYIERGQDNYRGAQTVRDFRAWGWQDQACVDDHINASTNPAAPVADDTATACRHKTFFSVRLPIDALRDALFQQNKPQWPPADLDEFRIQVQVLPPGDGAAIFDNARDVGTPLFSLADLATLLLPGEEVLITSKAKSPNSGSWLIKGKVDATEIAAPWLVRLVRKLPVDDATAKAETPLLLKDEIITPAGTFQVAVSGDARSVNRNLSVVATRLSWFVIAMLLAIVSAWLLIEISLIRRIAKLTQRTRGLSQTVHADTGLERYDMSDLRGKDEMGILATGMNELLRRVKEDLAREQIRTAQEKEQWHAVGHEIMSPLQSLLALHRNADDPSQRYIMRMQQAVRVLYGSASPSEAFESSRLQIHTLDIVQFLHHVAANAGIEGVIFTADHTPVLVRADEFSLEDVFSHLLSNALRYRDAGTPITFALTTSETTAFISVSNTGSRIPNNLIDKIFEYGVSDQDAVDANSNRGQGLFVAKTYLAKMGGTISVSNTKDGVCFSLSLQRAAV